MGNNEDFMKLLNSIRDLKEVSSTVHNERLVINNNNIGEVISIEQLENPLNGNF